MENQKAYYVSRKNVLTWFSVLLILCSAVVRLGLDCEKGTVSGAAWAFQILMPVLAELLFVLIVLLSGRERLYRTAIPVTLYCIAEMCIASGYGLWHRLLAWLAALVVAFYYAEVISGRIRGWADRLMLNLLLLGLLLIRILPDDLMLRRFRTAADWYRDLPLLFALSGLLMLMLATAPHRDGKYHRTWGDRPDGRRVRGIKPLDHVAAYIMPTRNGASNYFRDTIDVTDIDRYIRRRRREGMTHLTITEIYLAAYCRTIARYPAINRFLSGQHVYSRDGDIVFNMIVKREMSTTGEETAIKLHLSPSDTLDDVCEKFYAAVREAKAETGSNFDQTARALKMIPGVLLKFAVWFLKLLDYFGLLPGALLEVSPFHGSIFFTSMASLGIPAIFHHLYDFGNMPVFCCLGTKYRKNVVHSDGTVEERKFMDFSVVCDERICDGFYYAATLKAFKRYIMHPEQLEAPPEVVNADIY